MRGWLEAIASLSGAKRGLKPPPHEDADLPFLIASLSGAKRGLKRPAARAHRPLPGHRFALRSEARIETPTRSGTPLSYWDRFALRSEARIETRRSTPARRNESIASLSGAKRGLKRVAIRAIRRIHTHRFALRSEARIETHISPPMRNGIMYRFALRSEARIETAIISPCPRIRQSLRSPERSAD